jgi:hypothetical protein
VADIELDSLEDLEKVVVENGNVASVMMWEVRDAYDAERLGVHVRAGIEKALAKLGLGHYPKEIPDRQDQVLRVFKLGTPVADLIGAVLTPGEDEDERIREAVGGDEAQLLEKVRELVCA